MGLFAVLLPLQILFRLLAEHVGHIAAEDHVDLAAHGEVGGVAVGGHDDHHVMAVGGDVQVYGRAHHPDEVEALLNAARPLPHQRLICAFQPHTYTRTAALFDDFVRVLRMPDKVVLAEIYAAREKNELGISSRDLAAQIPGAVYCSTLEQVTEELARLAQPGDMIITVGAGDIYRAGEMLLNRGDAE